MTTSTQTQLRRGTASQVAAMTPALGEVVVNTTDKRLHLGDGTTAGGNPLAPLASPAFTGTPALPTGTTAVTQTAGDSTTKPATTAFVTAAIAAIPPSSGLPAAVTGSLTTGSSATLIVDFTTYAAYAVYVDELTATPGVSAAYIDVSTNGGTSYATAARYAMTFNGSTGSNTTNEMSMTSGRSAALVGTLTQGNTAGGATLAYTGGRSIDFVHTGTVRYATTAAVNRVQLSVTGGTFSTGTVILQPLSKR